ncbi:MAG TPA: dihydroneopterin aldolase [Desulfotomaculum sp.]|nr:dihydroneopterin aldolase [Desulfotomaculum sp.]
MDKIFIEGMVFFGRHGVLPVEREAGQRFLADVTLYLDLSPAGCGDDLSKTVDYLDVYGTVEEVVCGRSFRLIETLAETVAAALLERFPVSEVSVRIRKPGAPLPGFFEAVGVEVLRRRK